VRPFLGEGDAILVEVFDDHALIASLGLHAVVNVPLLAGGRCVATFNVLGIRSQWQPHELMLARLLAVLATPWVLQASADTQSTKDAML
jgi:GAF domain-containing protein